MSTVLLAVGDAELRRACQKQLCAAGHAALLVDRPLSLLSLSQRLRWDALCVDGSELGRSVLAVACQAPGRPRLLALGVEIEGATQTLRLPLAAEELLAAIESPLQRPRSIRLDPAARRVLLDDREVRLSDIEFRLFRLLHERGPEGVSLEEAGATVWGSPAEEPGGSALRVHVRNLRVKLAAAGLADAVQSRRGRGYALVL